MRVRLTKPLMRLLGRHRRLQAEAYATTYRRSPSSSRTVSFRVKLLVPR